MVPDSGPGDWLAVAALGLCFFGLFFVLYNLAVSYTTAARASLALSTLPLQTMIVGALLGIASFAGALVLGELAATLYFRFALGFSQDLFGQDIAWSYRPASGPGDGNADGLLGGR